MKRINQLIILGICFLLMGCVISYFKKVKTIAKDGHYTVTTEISVNGVSHIVVHDGDDIYVDGNFYKKFHGKVDVEMKNGNLMINYSKNIILEIGD